jgi:hypothetical protein
MKPKTFGDRYEEKKEEIARLRFLLDNAEKQIEKGKQEERARILKIIREKLRQAKQDLKRDLDTINFDVCQGEIIAFEELIKLIESVESVESVEQEKEK